MAYTLKRRDTLSSGIRHSQVKIDRVKALLREGLQQRVICQRIKISKQVLRTIRREMIEAGEIQGEHTLKSGRPFFDADASDYMPGPEFHSR